MNSETQTKLRELLRLRAKSIVDPAGRKIEILEDAEATAIANECRITVHEVYAQALRLEICPHRYERNMEIISLQDQLKLAESKVSVIGAGGLGGHVILLLARLGIGRLVVVDYDVFDESNLNRQALSNLNSLGSSKCETAAAAVVLINPGVEVSPYQVKLDSLNGSEILADSDVVVDALDNLPDRLLLEKLTKELGIPLVHGALAGFEGQVMTIFPEDPGLRHLYGDGVQHIDKSKSPESVLGVPTLTPSLVATLEAMEVLKVILKRGKIFRNAMLYVDMEAGQINEFTFGGG